MPEITFTSPAPLVATVHLTGATMRQVTALDAGGGLVEIELSDYEVGARISARADVLANLLADAVDAVARLRGHH
ncbi:MAG: hypothetical protein R2761_09650 [Acidimicrobiales bacterium]